MAWPGIPSNPILPTPSSMEMKMYELTEHVRSMQIVQAEQSRRLDEQSYRLHQLEMKDLLTNRFENQRYLWGPGAVGDNGPSSKTLTGLGFEVFSGAGRENRHEEKRIEMEQSSTNGIIII